MNAAGRRAIVLGGGVAGISAAFGLRDRGFRVTLLEAHGWLGGRAFSFDDRASGLRLDNGPHVLLGCYQAMRALLRRLGTEQDFLRADGLAVAYRTAAGARARLQLGRLPVPLALPLGLMRLPWSWRERLAALRGLAAAWRAPPPAWSLQEWLRRRGQSGAPAAWLWQPLCRAIMNAEPAAVSAALFLATLRAAFAGRAAAAAIWLPRRPWGELLGAPALQRLRAAGIDVRLGARVVGVQAHGGEVAVLALGDGTSLPCGDALVVSALPWHALDLLLPGAGTFGGLAGSPLVAVHFAFDDESAAPPDEAPLTVLVDGAPFHFLSRRPGAPRGQCTLVAGGCREFDGCSVAAIEQQARAQLARWFPGTDADGRARVRVSKEARATFVAGPGDGGRRPRAGRLPGGPRNLLVCGDWTDTGLPATLEGAARSAAEMLAAT